MTASAKSIKGNRYGGSDNLPPMLLSLPLYAAASFFAGTLAGQGSAGYAVAHASWDANTKIRGCWSRDYTGGTASGDARGDVEQGTFYFDNATAADAIDITYEGKMAYAVDNNTVANNSAGGTRPPAGRIEHYNTTTGKVAVRVGEPTTGSIDYSSPRFFARGSTITNHSLSAFTVATNTDGITYVAGDVVLLVGQTDVTQNGPWIVGTVATTAPLTRPTWWATGAAIQQGAIIELGGEGTLRGGTSYKAFCGKSKIVGTDSPLLYPDAVKGTANISGGTAAVATVSISTQAIGVCSDATTASKTAVMALTAGADQTGSIAFSGGNGTDAISYVVTNW